MANCFQSAPFSFFQKVDAGLTTNRYVSAIKVGSGDILRLHRFSQDLEIIDMDLPVDAINTSMCKFASFYSTVKLS